jgi:predicted dehydrogenase
MGATADEKAARWAIAPLWLPLAHASAITAAEGTELVAVCDVRETAARQTMERYGARAYYTDYREMLARESLDAVAIATRTPERKAVIEACTQAGIRALFCEKPLCRTLEDADELVALLRKHSVAFVYGTRRRFMPVYGRVQREIAGGRIGNIHTIVIRFGRSPLLWTHPHTVDIASFFAGDASPESVQADLDLDPEAVSATEIDADPLVRSATIRFANGISAHLVSSESFDVEIAGSEGMVTIESDGAAVVWRTRLPSPVPAFDPGHLLHHERIENQDVDSGTAVSIRALLGAMRGDGTLYPPELTIRNLEMLFAMVESHLADGARVRWPIARRGLRVTGRLGELFP